MISNQAKAGFDSLLAKSLRDGLSSDEVTEIEVVEHIPAIDKQQAVVLTVSSYVFRLLVMIHFDAAGMVRSYMERKQGVTEMDDRLFLDAIAEFGNLSCGILNRDLGNYFPHLGMSTPNYVEGRCVNYLEMLGYNHAQHFAVKINGEALFHASLCVKAYEEIHFVVNEQEERAETGELELF
ncbi:hypothetical protein [uncultured Oxalicibacterium sp.]|uniref:hypothetical protein n=1 Tax=uncultured Oxalicibacterium sp. TaxID=1168540 RepID=UPI0025DA9B70|nr:hypothetical protein [uncultured Oxalicibacterium sp.]